MIFNTYLQMFKKIFEISYSIFQKFFNDFKKDYFSNNAQSQIVLILGLPKSGTTMIEWI